MLHTPESDPAFVPDGMTPMQFIGALQTGSQRDPEKSLMYAVLKDAIEVALMGGKVWTKASARIARREAMLWLLDTDLEWPFSFENVCGELGINVDYLRAGIVRTYREIETGQRAPLSRQLTPRKVKPCDDERSEEKGA